VNVAPVAQLDRAIASGDLPHREFNNLHGLLRIATKCYRSLVQQGFPAILEHSVTLGRVWWWAQNWAQSLRCSVSPTKGRSSSPRFVPGVRTGGRGPIKGVKVSQRVPLRSGWTFARKCSQIFNFQVSNFDFLKILAR
jgi:hypothetical protein